ncbi:MerR family transcriptional regulator [Fredinandcohnia sp. QZ13]|uniref:MerR family transcriptional regulator n=1 Tax=Fredinandcohnia sp. QZ13 TaxID=3073144 RepID=UPI0028534DC9|nr:MerR family transcriptional regulator [Fredinandcohnia sp. QZ13]MDR4888270.1 MerR family transcriptional regulator [Fredinandcohnia sp. QZ13]
MYRIGELAKEANVSKRTIDYYTQLGILTPERSDSNYRFYSDEAVETLHLVAQYKELNIPLLEIKEKVELFHTNRVEQEKVLKYTQALSKRMEYLETELKDMKPMLESLSEEQQKSVMSKMSTQSMTLAKLLMVLFT